MTMKIRLLSAILLLGLAMGLCGCFTVATEADLKAAQEKLAGDIRAIESAVVDAIPLPIPRDATKEMLGWLSDLVILGGGAGAAGVGVNKLRNGRKAKKTA